MKRYWKRNFCIVISVVFLLLLFTLTSFSQEYYWKFAVSTSNPSFGYLLDSIANDVNEATNGQVKIDYFYPGEHPYKGADVLRAVSSGEFEMAGIHPGYISGVEPTFGIMELPLLIPNGEFEIYLQLYEKFRQGYFKEILEKKWNLKESFSIMMSGQQFYLKDGWIEDFNSLKGKKIRTWCIELTDLIKLLNANPVSLPLSENYTALQTGLLDGTTTNFVAAYQNNFFDLCKYVSLTEHVFSTIMCVINQDAWNQLPDELKETVTEVYEANRDKLYRDLQTKAAVTLQEAIIKQGIKVSALPKAFRKELQEKVYEAVWKPWLNRSGEEGKKVFDTAVDLFKEMGYSIMD